MGKKNCIYYRLHQFQSPTYLPEHQFAADNIPEKEIACKQQSNIFDLDAELINVCKIDTFKKRINLFIENLVKLHLFDFGFLSPHYFLKEILVIKWQFDDIFNVLVAINIS